jgi:allophanate hydrolase-like protein
MSLDESINEKIKISICAVVLLAATSVQSDAAVFAQECVEIAVSGTLMRGLELEPNLVNLDAPPVGGGGGQPPVGGGGQPPVGGGGQPPVGGGGQPPVGGGGGQPPVGGTELPVLGAQPPVSGGGAQSPVSGGGAQPPEGGRQQQLQELAGLQGSSFVREDKTMPEYRLYSINDVLPAMIRVPANTTNGVSVIVEIWCVPADGLATLLGQEPLGLSIGKAKLMDNSTVLGVIAEPALLVGMKDISNFNGNWREYIAQTGLQLIDNATQSANLTSDQIAAVQQLRSEGELLAQNGQLRGAIDSLNTAIKMLGLKDRLYLNIPLEQTAP